jgi:hypothetical protein
LVAFAGVTVPRPRVDVPAAGSGSAVRTVARPLAKSAPRPTRAQLRCDGVSRPPVRRLVHRSRFEPVRTLPGSLRFWSRDRPSFGRHAVGMRARKARIAMFVSLAGLTTACSGASSAPGATRSNGRAYRNEQLSGHGVEGRGDHRWPRTRLGRRVLARRQAAGHRAAGEAVLGRGHARGSAAKTVPRTSRMCSWPARAA